MMPNAQETWTKIEKLKKIKNIFEEEIACYL